MRYLCFVFLFLCWSLRAPAAANSEIAGLNGVCVIVNDTTITEGQVEKATESVQESLRIRYANQPQLLQQEWDKVRGEAINELVERALIMHEFKTAGYSLPESFIDDAIKDEIRRNYYGDRARLTKTLQARGETYEMFRAQEREYIIVSEMRKHNLSQQKILISPAKIENFYNEHQDNFKVPDQVKLRMISISEQPANPPGTARKLADEVLLKLDDGVPFADMAAIHCTGALRASGGDRGWVDRTQFKTEITTVAFSLKAGEHSKVIELPEACYLLMVEESRPAHVKPLAEVRSEIEQTLKAQEGNRLHQKWIDRLKAKAFIRYY